MRFSRLVAPVLVATILAGCDKKDEAGKAAGDQVAWVGDVPRFDYPIKNVHHSLGTISGDLVTPQGTYHFDNITHLANGKIEGDFVYVKGQALDTQDSGFLGTLAALEKPETPN
jgi:hypothetical protein